MRKHWDRHAAAWETHLPSTDLFSELLDAVMSAVTPASDDVAVDLGAGTGFLALQLAPHVRRVLAVDNSEEMLRRLRAKSGGGNLEILHQDLRHFRCPQAVDIVVSNYALHHLSHPAKRELLRRCHECMKPGGRIAIADIMVPLTFRPRESRALRHKVRVIARKGLPGYWRIGKNAFRWAIGHGEYPASRAFWENALREAGFTNVGVRQIGGESAVAWGTKVGAAPASGTTSTAAAAPT